MSTNTAVATGRGSHLPSGAKSSRPGICETPTSPTAKAANAGDCPRLSRKATACTAMANVVNDASTKAPDSSQNGADRNASLAATER